MEKLVTYPTNYNDMQHNIFILYIHMLGKTDKRAVHAHANIHTNMYTGIHVIAISRPIMSIHCLHVSWHWSCSNVYRNSLLFSWQFYSDSFLFCFPAHRCCKPSFFQFTNLCNIWHSIQFLFIRIVIFTILLFVQGKFSYHGQVLLP